MLVACAWVGPKDVDARLALVDDDGDGSVARDDCDDGDSKVFPGAEDAWYDGIDSDCLGNDDHDQDGDGYDALVSGGDDCDDLAAGTHPGAADPWYDGVDTDCGGNDDYDQDGDGYVSDASAGFRTTGVEGSGALPSGDCDDLDAAINPGMPDDWYSGVDEDCGGEDDYDADGDGFYASAVVYGATTYVDGSGFLPGGDCDDADPSIFPGATDAFYDGIDQDCAGGAEYDQDGDGIDDPSGGGIDCDDLDAEVYPGAMERLGDATDQDCDGDPNTFPLNPLPGWAWTNPQSPMLRVQESDGALYLSIVATEATDGTSNWFDSALALTLEAGVVTGTVPWAANTTDPSYEASEGQAFLVRDGVIHGAVGLVTGTGRALSAVRYDLASGDRDTVTYQSPGEREPFAGVGLTLTDEGVVYAVGCEDTEGVLAYLSVADVTGPADVTIEQSGVSAAFCAIDPRGLPYFLSGGRSGVTRWTWDAAAADPVFVGDTVSATLITTDIDWDEDDAWVASAAGVSSIGADAGVEITWSTSVAAARADVATGTTVGRWIAWTGEGTPWLSWREDASTTWDVPFAAAAEDVAVIESAGLLYLVVTGPDGVLMGVARTP